MALAAPLLTHRAVLLVGVEVTPGVNPGLSASTDACLVETPDYQVDVTILERDYARQDLSPLAHATGRKLAKFMFTTELRGSGKEQSGSLADAPLICRLFRGSSYALSAIAAPAATPMYDIGVQANPVAWSIDAAAATQTDVIGYHVAVTTPGASATAHVTVTSDIPGEGSASAVITTASPVTIGSHGITATPVFTGSLLTSQAWAFWALPLGLKLLPISGNQETLSMQLFLDGTMHEINNAMGTFSIDATAGQYAKVKWEFTGQYVAPTDAALPSPTIERTLPAQVQLARLRLDTYTAIVNAFSWTQANDIQPRPDVNGSDGYDGVRIVSRKPTAGVDPEASLVASHDFWGRLSAATMMPFQMRVGQAVGNTVWILGPQTQYNKLTYKDRTGIRAYDAGLSFTRYAGDDEIAFVFM